MFRHASIERLDALRRSYNALRDALIKTFGALIFIYFDAPSSRSYGRAPLYIERRASRPPDALIERFGAF